MSIFPGKNVVPYTEIEDETIRKECEARLAEDASISNIFVNKRTGYQTRYEKLGWGWTGVWRADMPDCTDRMKAKYPGRCDPIKGGGVSRRCPNTDRGCQFFFNYQKFLQCYNKFEHLGNDEAEAKCGFFLNGIPPSVRDYFQKLRDENNWLGIPSNWTPPSDDEDEDDDDDF